MNHIQGPFAAWQKGWLQILITKYNNMSLKIVVLAKQVPDTRNVGKDAMKADGNHQPGGAPGYLQPRRPQCPLSRHCV